MMDTLRSVDEAATRQYEYDDGSVVFAGDLGVTDATLDVVDGTAIVVTDEEQYEFELPDDHARVFMKNGVVTIEVTHGQGDL